MPEPKKKPDKAKADEKPGNAATEGDCESNDGEADDGPRKPKCAEGYPLEQPEKDSGA